MQKLVILGVFALLLAAISCDKATTSANYLDQADCTGIEASTNTYTANIKAILNNSCASSGCHSASSRRAGIDLSTYAAAKAAIQNTNCLCSIHHGSNCTPMPEGSAKLNDATIQLIDCWAKNGYAE